MNIKKLFLILLPILLIGVCTLSAQTKQEKKMAKKQALKELIVSRNYKIDINTVLPQNGRSIPLGSSYSLKIKNDSVFSYLPYYGRAYNIPYGGGNGLIFEAPINDYMMEMNKEGDAIIKFSVRNTEDFYNFHAKIFSNGFTSVDIIMQNRQSISFYGEIEDRTND